MANIVLSAKNAIDFAGTTFQGSADVDYPLVNFKDPVLSKVWRWSPATNADGNTAKFHMAFTAPVKANHVAFIRHNASKGARVRVRAGMARLDTDFADDDLTSPYWTFGGGANGTRTNEFGVMVAGTCPRLEHDRRAVHNGFRWSEDLSNPAWLTLVGGLKLSSDTVQFAKGDPAPSVGSELYQNLFENGYGLLQAGTYEFTAKVELLEGNGDFCFQLYNGTSYSQSATITATTGGLKAVTGTVTVTAGNPLALNYAYIHKLTSGGILRLTELQICYESSNGRYIKTTTQRRYKCLGLIDEQGSTNRLLHASDITNPVWGNSFTAGTVNPNVVIAPDGTTTFDRLTQVGARSGKFQEFAATGSSTHSGSFIFMCSASTATVGVLRFGYGFSGGGALQFTDVTFNPSTGAHISTTNSGGIVSSVGGVENLGHGFFRAYCINNSADAAHTMGFIEIDVADIAGRFMSFGCAQAELGSVTTYIPTTTTTVTRSAQTAGLENGTWAPYVLNPSEGTLYVEFQPNARASFGVYTVDIRLATTSGLEYLAHTYWFHSTNPLGGYVSFSNVVGGVNQWSVNLVAMPAGAVIRTGFRYRSNDHKAAINGAVQANVLNGPTPAVTRLNLVVNASVTRFIRRVTYWPSGKTDAELQALTTIGPGAIDFDSGWSNALQMKMRGDVPALWGHEYDIPKAFSSRAVEWVRVQLYDPAKTDSLKPFEIGRAFVGSVTFQPRRNAEFPSLQSGWRERSTYVESYSGRKFFNVLPKGREQTLAFPFLELEEGDAWHEIQDLCGTSEEVMYIPDPDNEADCQRYGGLGRLSKLDPLRHTFVKNKAAAVVWEKKR